MWIEFSHVVPDKVADRRCFRVLLRFHAFGSEVDLERPVVSLVDVDLLRDYPTENADVQSQGHQLQEDDGRKDRRVATVEDEELAADTLHSKAPLGVDGIVPYN